MPLDWTNLFTRTDPAAPRWVNGWDLASPPRLSSLKELKLFLDLTHIKYCLAKPFCELRDYPLVDVREMLPSFESDPLEHGQLPGLSLVALARPIDYFSEVFQFDLLSPPNGGMHSDDDQARGKMNYDAIRSRLPRCMHEPFAQTFYKKDVTELAVYPALVPYLTQIDRGQVLGIRSTEKDNATFCLHGIYASFPSDLDTEVKRYGLRIGKFTMDEPASYQRNRQFVLQHLMELYGYPISSERRTSAALFARRLHKMGERFLIRTLGQSDRTLTTMWSDGESRPYPHVEKTALISLDAAASELMEQLHEQGYFLDARQRVIILRIRYRQHKFSPDNVRQERALSVAFQEAIHPYTGQVLRGNIIREATNMFLRLNDVVRGEYAGRIVYKRTEVIENTETEENRLKFIYAWLCKHQRRIIGYSDDFFGNILTVLDGYLLSQDKEIKFADTKELYQELMQQYYYIQQARKIRLLEDLQKRNLRGVRITYNRMLRDAVELLHDLKFEIATYFDTLVTAAIAVGDAMLNDRYLLRTYIERPEQELTPSGLEIKRNFSKMVTLMDEFKAIKQNRASGIKGSATLGNV